MCGLSERMIASGIRGVNQMFIGYCYETIKRPDCFIGSKIRPPHYLPMDLGHSELGQLALS